ncbi:right-handed parallel beta-helix repeat-containing protein [Halomonas denitrificans]|nr:right-handed parallel beta-helix repeat-containing protein [Halomonas denitrificans]
MERTRWTWGLAFALLSKGAIAGGVIEIHQLCVADGCFDGDFPGYPVTVLHPGSYRLSSNLAVDPGETAIFIDSDQVDLDLNGFTLRGGFGCSGPLPLCSADTGETGIWVDSGRVGVSIHGGAVRGMGSVGIRASSVLNLGIRNVSIHDCGNGIVANASGGYGVVDSVMVGRSGFAGIRATEAIQIRDSQFINNYSEGADGGTCIRNVFRDNGDGQGLPEESCDVQIDGNLCNGGFCP